MTLLVEACADGVDSALGAAAGGAGRLELCDNLLEGGTTPSAGMIEVVRDRVTLPLFVLVRPRAGDFCYDGDELEVMIRNIRRATASGVVMVGGGIDESSAAEVVTRTGVREVHVRGARSEEGRGRRNPRVSLRKPAPGDEFGRAGTDPARIHHIVASVPAAGGAIPSSPRAGRS